MVILKHSHQNSLREGNSDIWFEDLQCNALSASAMRDQKNFTGKSFLNAYPVQFIDFMPSQACSDFKTGTLQNIRKMCQQTNIYAFSEDLCEHQRELLQYCDPFVF